MGSGPLKLEADGGSVRMDERILEKHLLFLGSAGSGKTNGIFQVVRELRRTMSKNDVMIIFDTKGDYVNEFYRKDCGDKVIATRKDAVHDFVNWNLFRDISFKSNGHDSESANEIARTLFDDLEKRSKDIFFPYSARDLTKAVFLALIRKLKPVSPTNAEIRRFLYEGDVDQTKALVGEFSDLKGALQYVQLEGGQSQGVLSTIKIMVQDLFSGSFGEPGDFSVREFVAQKGGRALFIEYDIDSGRTLTPIYRVLCDLAIKEALSRTRTEGNVYFVIDEFALLPNLYHVESGLNFGRSLGTKFVVGTQNVSQIYEGYGRETGLSLLSSFGSVFSFRLYDAASRDFVSGRYGANLQKVHMVHSAPGSETKVEQVVNGKVVEDWHLAFLETGEAVVSMFNLGPPRLVRFERYRSPVDERHTA